MVKKCKSLELELHTETKCRRELEDRSSTPERIRNRRNARSTAVDKERLVLPDSFLVVENVEPVNLQTKLFTFTNGDRVVSAEIQVPGPRCATVARNGIDCRAARYATEARDTEAFVVTIERVRNQRVERNTRLCTERTAGHEFEWPLIAAIKLELVRTIVGQSAIKTVEQADEVEQRSDVRVSLAVVITEQSFIVTNQAREHIRSDELIVVREALRGGELEGPVVAAGWTKATDERVVYRPDLRSCSKLPVPRRPGLNKK